MKKFVLFIIFAAHTAYSSGQIDFATHVLDKQQTAEIVEDYIGNSPIKFRENLGQYPDEVLFRGISVNSNVYFLKDGLSFGFIRPYEDETGKSDHNSEALVYNLEFVNHNPNFTVSKFGKESSNTNYFKGNDHSRHVKNTPDFQEITYKNIYPNINLKYYGNGKELKYDYILKPGADMTDIKMRLDGVKGISINRNGQLEIDTEWGILIEKAPYSYQLINGVENEIDIRYELKDDNTYGFKIAGEFNPNYDLIIDPVVLEWSTFVGSKTTGDGYLLDQAVDMKGNLYAVGNYLEDFPTTPGVYEPNFQGVGGGILGPNYDAYAFKLSADGTTLLWSTYIGSSSSTDIGTGIAVSDAGEVYITGCTQANDFPTSANAFMPSGTGPGNWNFFVSKLSNDGANLIYSTYIGGKGTERSVWSQDVDQMEPKGNAGNGFYKIPSIDVNKNGEAFVAGNTSSDDFPIKNAFQATRKSTGFTGLDACLTKLNAAGTDIIFSTYFGGSEPDEANEVIVDDNGNAYITGYTKSSDFPAMTGTLNGTCDVFVAKFDGNGNRQYSMLVGGGGDAEEEGLGIDVNKTSGELYVTGWTRSKSFPTINAYDNTFNPTGTYTIGENKGKSYPDAFVFKVNAAGNQLVYSTYIGGSTAQAGEDLALSAGGDVFITGFTTSNDFPVTSCAVQKTYTEKKDLFLSILSEDGSKLVYSQYFGAAATGGGLEGEEYHSNVDFVYTECLEEVVISITTHSQAFPTTAGSYQPDKGTYGGYDDQPAAFKLKPEMDVNFKVTNTPQCGETIVFTDITTSNCVWEEGPWEPDTWEWDFGDGTILTGKGPHDHVYDAPGTYQVKLKVSCPRDSVIIPVTIPPDNTPTINLGPDQEHCKNTTSSVTIDAGPGGANYEWNTGETTQSITVNQDGEYYVLVDNGGKCKAMDTIEVNFNDPPVVVLNFDPVCEGETITLDAGNPGANYNWSTGDTTQTVEISQAGNYSVTVGYGDSGDCDAKEAIDVTFIPGPVVDLQDVSTCGDNTVLDAGAGADSYEWSTGETTQTITVSTPGDYWVKVSDASGQCTNDDTANVNFNGDLLVNLPDDLTLCGDTSLTLDAGNPGATYTWSTGDTTQTIDINTSGTYDVLVEKDGCDGTGEITLEVNPVPEAGFIPDEICLGDTNTFSDTSLANGATITSWQWSFGDGSSSTEQNPDHNYSGPGEYEVSLSLTTDKGCTSTVLDTAIVSNSPEAGFSSTVGCEGAPTRFTDESTIDPGTIVSWLWLFGDGDTSSLENPVHQYAAPGNYDVTLVTVSAGGCIDTIVKPVEVHPKPVAAFSDAQGCAPLEVDLEDQSTGDIVTWVWDMGNGVMSTEQHPSTVYEDTGAYDVQLVVTTAARCSDTLKIVGNVIVNPTAEADFDANPWETTIMDPTIQFEDLSSSDVNSWSWDFGDGSSVSEVQDPQHKYAEAGEYEVKLIVNNEYGCPAEIIKPVKIDPIFKFYVPNAFTPNGKGPDGSEGFIGQGVGVEEHEMWVYDRWGLMIYHTDNTKQGRAIPWNGKVNGRGPDAQEDVYVYVVKIKDVFGKRHKFVGHVTLLK